MKEGEAHNAETACRAIGIMSMHRILNYGSILQAYSLKRLIEDTVADVSVRFIDYRPGKPVGSAPRVNTSLGGRVLGITSAVTGFLRHGVSPIDVLKYYRFKSAFGRRWWPLIGCTDQFDYSTDVDVQVVGSDEVFNCTQPGRAVGYAPALFGAQTEAGRLVSYAASFGSTTSVKLEHAGVIGEVAGHLMKFDEISVRDENSRQIVASLTGREPRLNVDPVLAHDVMKDPRVPSERLRNDKYVISYGYSTRITRREARAIREFAQGIGAKVLCFGGVQAESDEFVDCSPFELLAYFRDAEAVVTDTFHGTIFSIINQTPFATFVRGADSRSSTSNSNKLQYLLDQFGVAERAASARTLHTVLGKGVDWGHVEKTLNAARATSRAYLAESLAA